MTTVLQNLPKGQRGTGLGLTARQQHQGQLGRFAADHPLSLFFALAYAFSWCLFLPMILAGAVSPALIVVASFGPSMAAIGAHRLGTGGYRAFHFVSTWPRVALGAVVGCMLVVGAYVVLPGVISADPRQLNWRILASVAVYDASTLLGGPLGEEPGWRGYALPRLEERFGPVRGTLLMAFLWAGWHLPLFLVPGWTSSPLWTYVLILIGVSVIMTFGVHLAGFSVAAAIAMHAAFNTVSRFLAGLFTGAQPRVQVSFVTLLALSGLATALLLIVVTRGRLAYPQGRRAG
jgi:uncharacterized protein